MKTEWNLDFANEKTFSAFRIEAERVYDDFVSRWKENSTYLDAPETLLEALNDYENIVRKYSGCGNEGYFYWLKQELNQADSKIRQKFLKAEEFAKAQSNKVLFFTISLSKISEEKQKEFLENKILEKYRGFLFRIFENAKYVLSEPEEKILSLKESGSLGMWVKMVESLLSKETFDLDGKERTYDELLSIMESPNKKLRDEAKEGFEKIMSKYEDVAEVELNAVLENAKVDDELRGFVRPDEVRIKGDSIDLEFVDSLLEAVKEKFYLSHKYYSLVAKLIGQEKMGYYERNVGAGEIEKKYSYEEGVEMVKEVFSRLDKEFLKIFEQMLDEGKIDAFPKKGKQGGAFCVGVGLNKPVYVLLNYTENLRDVTTIAHEMGHAINDVFMQKKVDALNFGTPKATAEVASIFMEDFVFEKILENSTDEEKFYLIFKKIGDEIGSIFRQIALYLFELEIHKTYRKEGYLSKEKIGEMFVKHMSEYLGDAVDMGNAHLWWIYWSHIRMYFYVYSYASGALISKTMQEKYRKDNSFIEKIKIFLETGEAKTPREIFAELGIKIDKKFFSEGLNSIEKNLDEVISLGKKLGKL